jgi:hypothetical protein
VAAVVDHVPGDDQLEIRHVEDARAVGVGVADLDDHEIVSSPRACAWSVVNPRVREHRILVAADQRARQWRELLRLAVRKVTVVLSRRVVDENVVREGFPAGSFDACGVAPVLESVVVMSTSVGDVEASRSRSSSCADPGYCPGLPSTVPGPAGDCSAHVVRVDQGSGQGA